MNADKCRSSTNYRLPATGYRLLLPSPATGNSLSTAKDARILQDKYGVLTRSHQATKAGREEMIRRRRPERRRGINAAGRRCNHPSQIRNRRCKCLSHLHTRGSAAPLACHLSPVTYHLRSCHLSLITSGPAAPPPRARGQMASIQKVPSSPRPVAW
jgi:hypothetical protein